MKCKWIATIYFDSDNEPVFEMCECMTIDQIEDAAAIQIQRNISDKMKFDDLTDAAKYYQQIAFTALYITKVKQEEGIDTHTIRIPYDEQVPMEKFQQDVKSMKLEDLVKEYGIPMLDIEEKSLYKGN